MSDPKIWNNRNLNKLNSNRYFPSEMILRAVFSNKYFNNIIKNKIGSKILDVGCLFANNLVPFSDRGYELYGTEVTDEGVEIALDSMINQKIEVKVVKGFNTDLPFKSNFFEIVLSIATIHYEENIKNINKAFFEFARVLKKDGSLILKTVAPKHEMYVNSRRLEKNLFILDYETDLRHNQRFFFFENEIELKEIAEKYFEIVDIARITESYPKLTLDFYLISCYKPKI